MKNFTLTLIFIYIFPFLGMSFPADGETPVTSPVTFLENKGQWDSEILYQGNSTTTHVFFLRAGLSFAQPGEEIENPDGTDDYPFVVWNMKFVKSNPDVVVTGDNGKPSKVSYLYGKDSTKWVIQPPEFSRLRYNNIYDNIDLDFFGSGRDLKYDYNIHPGGTITSIKAFYEGVEQLSINNAGELEIKTLFNTQVQKTPIAWQIINDRKHFVKIDYLLINDSTFGFVAPLGYDLKFDLVIDPLFQMVWASYTQATGASNNINYCFSSAMDNDGNVYMTGMVDGTFPITPGAYSGPGNISPEIFVAKFSSDGTTMLYSTYLPGNSSEHGVDIAVDDSGRAYVTGVVELNITGITNFPSTPNAYQPVHSSGSDAFLTVLNPSGTGLVYSTFLGGSGGEGGMGVALGDPGIAYITGATSIGNFPVKASSAFPTGDNDVFVAKFDINQAGNNSLIYSTRIGGGSFSSVHGRSITVNSAGNAFVTGTVFSSFGPLNFPLTPGAYSSVYNTGQDNIMSFVIKLSATTPVTLDYSTFLGPGTSNSIAVDANDEVYITGGTRTFAFPTTPGSLQPVHGQDAVGNPNSDVYVVKMNAAGSGIVYSTFLGGPVSESGSGIAINSSGECYVTGIAQDGFPTSPGAYQPANAGSYDFFVVHVNATGSAYGCGGSTYVGGSDADYTGSFYDYPSPHISIRDHAGNNDTILVSSTSHSQDFPTTPGVYGPIKVNGIADQPVFFKLTCATTGAPPVASINSVTQSSCNTAVVNFSDNSSGAPSSWQWYFPGGTPASSSIQNPQGISYTSSGSYTVSLVACNSFGCDSTITTIQITITPDITVNIGNDTTLCQGTTATLSALPGMLTYNWQLNGAATGANQPSLIVSQPGIYTIQVTDSAGCTGVDTLVVAINNPLVSLGADLNFCNGDSVVVNAGSGFTTYQWFLNGNVISQTDSSVYVTAPGSLSVLITDALGCTASDTITILTSTPVVDAGQDVLLCNNDSALVNVTPGYQNYQWYLNGNFISQTGNSIYVNLPGIYLVEVTDSLGCTASDSLTVTTGSLSVALINDTSFCSGNTITLMAGAGFSSYQWQLNSNTISSNDTLVVSQSGSYSVTVTNAQGCSASDTTVISINNLPVVQTINDVAVCEGDSITLATTGADNYSWSPATYLSSSSVPDPVTSPVATITYTVTGTDVNGCTGTDEITIQVADIPVASFEFTLDYSCKGILLTTDNNSVNAESYLWSFGDGQISTVANPLHYFTTLQNQTIQLIAISGACTDTSTVSNVSFDIPAFNNIPNVFSPNGDGKNDCFKIEEIGKLAECYELIIFNRWGNKVYSTGNTDNCWDGKSNGGDKLPAGVYFYIVTIGESDYEGTVHLIK